ncbi:DinB family protein [Pelagibius sp. Alg239-R121]|uniref:DinB family protein n=1 Tax=Pelagibius sp. Alg239-R121 TaxID=2993448 RepID=UPI0024A6A91A|nr:DinB family protein [Pelagibius sp. Alg239-R121]
MPDKEYTLTMARYNLWQNESLLAAADSLSAAEREKDRGSFFGSIQQTLSHIYWGDMIWLSRFAGTQAPDGGIPESVALIESWDKFRDDRKVFDERILQWAHEVSPTWFEGDLGWFSGALGRDVTKPKKILVIQLFNHQTHHRGQIHAMLTSVGAKPDDTDVPFMPERFLRM